MFKYIVTFLIGLSSITVNANENCNKALASNELNYATRVFLVSEEFAAATKEIRSLYNPGALAFGEILEESTGDRIEIQIEVLGASSITGQWITLGVLLAEMQVVFGGSPVVLWSEYQAN